MESSFLQRIDSVRAAGDNNGQPSNGLRWTDILQRGQSGPFQDGFTLPRPSLQAKSPDDPKLGSARPALHGRLRAQLYGEPDGPLPESGQQPLSAYFSL